MYKLKKIMHKKVRKDKNYILPKGSLRKDIIPTKPRFRSIPDITVLNS